MAVRRLDLIITSNATAALRGFASLEGAAKRMETKFGAAGRAMFNVGVVGTAAFAAFTAKSVKAFIDFDDAMTKSTAILDNLSGPTRKRLEDAAKAIARTTTFSATEAAEAFYGLFSAGLDAEQTISAIPVVAQFAQAALMEMGEATDYLVNAQASLGLSMEDPIKNMQQMQRVADVLTETNNLATGTVEEFAEALTHKAGGALKTVGKDIEEGAAALAYLAEQGVRGSRAGESLAIFIRDVSRAAGNKAFKGAFRDFGIEVFDSTGNLKNLADVVGEFETALGPMSDQQRAVTLEQLGLTRSVGDVIRALMGGSDEIRGFELALRGAGGATEEVANKQMESLRSKLEIIKNRFEVLMIEFGEPVAFWLVEVFFPWLETQFIPAIRDTTTLVRDELRPAFEALRDLFDNEAFTKIFSLFVGYVAAANGATAAWRGLIKILKPALLILRPLRWLLGQLSFAFFLIRYAIMGFVVPALQALAAAIGISIGWFILIVAAIVLVVVGVLFFRDEIGAALSEVGKFFSGLWDDIFENFVRPVIDWFTGPFVDFWKGLWHTIEGPVKFLLNMLGLAAKIIILVFAMPFIIVGAIIFAAVSAIVGFVTTNWGKVTSWLGEQWQMMKEQVVAFWQSFLFPFLKIAWTVISTIIGGGVAIVVGIFTRFWEALKRATQTVWGGISFLIFGAWHIIRDGVIKPLTHIWADRVLPRIQDFQAKLADAWGSIQSTASAAWRWLKRNVLDKLANYWSESVLPKIEAFRDALSGVWGFVSRVAALAWSGMVVAIRRPVNAIIRIINALIGGINAVLGLINKIPGTDIPMIPKIPLIGGGGGGGGAPVGQELNINPGMAGVAHAMGTYDLAKRGPFKTTGPRAIVGEGDARFPEYVIPTDPRYRGRASMLFHGLAKDLGIKNMAIGGIIDSVSDGIKGAIDAAGGFVEGVQRGALKAAFSPFNNAAKNALNTLPDFFLRDVAQAFRRLIWDVVTGADSGFPEDTGSGLGASAAGLVGFAARAMAVFKQMFPGMTIGGWRAKGSVPGSDHPKGKALDLMTTNPMVANTIIGKFLTMEGRKYWIWNRRIATASGGFNPRGYSGPSPHTDHVHLSFYKHGGQIPSLASGLARVPRDNYLANLHQDEAVLNRRQADEWRSGGAVHIQNVNINIDGAGSLDDARRKGRAAGKAFLETLEERRVLTDARNS
jgi:TP901 family phage tail tape measure protein